MGEYNGQELPDEQRLTQARQEFTATGDRALARAELEKALRAPKRAARAEFVRSQRPETRNYVLYDHRKAPQDAPVSYRPYFTPRPLSTSPGAACAVAPIASPRKYGRPLGMPYSWTPMFMSVRSLRRWSLIANIAVAFATN
jgi:hypothetical protein